MGYMKDLFGAACLGATYRTLHGLTAPKKITTKTRTENGERTEEYKDTSITGGAVRGAVVALLLKGANWGLGETVHNTASRYGGRFAEYVGRASNQSISQTLRDEAEEEQVSSYEIRAPNIDPNAMSQQANERDQRTRNRRRVIDDFLRGDQNGQ